MPTGRRRFSEVFVLNIFHERAWTTGNYLKAKFKYKSKNIFINEAPDLRSCTCSDLQRRRSSRFTQATSEARTPWLCVWKSRPVSSSVSFHLAVLLIADRLADERSLHVEAEIRPRAHRSSLRLGRAALSQTLWKWAPRSPWLPNGHAAALHSLAVDSFWSFISKRCRQKLWQETRWSRVWVALRDLKTRRVWRKKFFFFFFSCALLIVLK